MIDNLMNNNIKIENTICKLIDAINENNLNFFIKIIYLILNIILIN